MTEDEKKLFDDLCPVVIYHYCDVLYKKKAEKALPRLLEKNIMDSMEDGDKAYEQYEKMVLAYVEDALPSRFKMRYDYWGAKVITDDTQRNAPKTGYFAGDNCGRIMFFDGYSAMAEYTKDIVNRIQQQENDSTF